MKTKFYASCMTLCMFFLSTNTISAQHEYVDLGLSVKWATCNVGANVPEEFGKYFAWGEVLPKSNYHWDTYKYLQYGNQYKNGWSALTKYCTNVESGYVDNKTTLETIDDAATYNWGDSWRMPTIEEWKELLEQCIVIWSPRNGVDGYEVKSKVNDNSIFLTYSRVRRATSFGYAENGWYWSASLSDANPDGAWCVRIGDINGVNYRIDARCFGLPVRPVYP